MIQMNGELLLDTNAVMGLFADDAALRDHVAQSSRILVAAVVPGELYYGARKSTRVEENMALPFLGAILQEYGL